jgi:hypothetical protein
MQLMFLGINIFLSLVRTHFNPRYTRASKISLCRAKNIFNLCPRISTLLLYTGCIKKLNRFEIALNFANQLQQFASKHKPQTFSRVFLRLKRGVYRWKLKCIHR